MVSESAMGTHEEMNKGRDLGVRLWLSANFESMLFLYTILFSYDSQIGKELFLIGVHFS